MTKVSVLMIKSVYTGVSGHDKVIANISIELQKLGYDVSIGSFSFQHDPPNEIAKINLKKTNLFFNKSIKKFDIIHTHEALINYYFLFSQKPIIYHYHGVNGFLQEINLKFSLFLLAKKFFKIISVSKTGFDYLHNISKNIPIEVIPNGVNTQLFKSNLSKKYDKGNPQLLFVGNMYPSKNIITLINAMPSILKIYPNAHLQIIGYGDSNDELKLAIHQLKLEKNIELVGELSHDVLKYYYSSCDVYVSASLAEAHPLPPLEALSSGKPLLLSNISAHEEIIKDSQAGLTFINFNIDDLCKKLLTIIEKNQLFSSNAIKFSKNCDWSITGKKIHQIYDQLID